MLQTLAIENYRSLRRLVLPLGALTLVTGANGSGKSNLYRALRLLAETAQGGVVAALAREGGLPSTLWAGPAQTSRRMRSGEVPVEGVRRDGPVALRLGFAGEDFGYAIDLGYPPPPRGAPTAFALDAEIKRECFWAGSFLRPANLMVDRRGAMLRARDGREWQVLEQHLDPYRSVFAQVADPERAPEVLRLREMLRGWRFYDHFRADADAPARHARLGTRTPVMSADGADLAAAWQTIREVGDSEALDAALEDAFPGARVDVEVQDGRFAPRFEQEGLLRPMTAAELSDGTLRYLLWIAVLHAPRPPPLMVLNEPETSLHPDLLPALARLIAQAAGRTQVWVVSHAPRLIAALEQQRACHPLALERDLGGTTLRGQQALDEPPWHWPER